MWSSTISVLPTSNRPLMLLGLRTAFNDQALFHVIGELTSLTDLIPVIASQPDAIAVVDARLFSGIGFTESVRLINQANLAARLVAVGPVVPLPWLQRLLDSGPMSYVWEGETIDTLVSAIRSAVDNRTWRSPLLDSRTVAGPESANYPDALSEREIEVLTLMAHGLTDAEVALRLGVHRRTVGFHLSQARDRLGTSSRVETVVMAARLGLLDLD